MGEVGERLKSPVEEVKQKANKTTAEQLICEDRRQRARLEPHVRTLLSPIAVAQLWCCEGKKKSLSPSSYPPLPYAQSRCGFYSPTAHFCGLLHCTATGDPGEGGKHQPNEPSRWPVGLKLSILVHTKMNAMNQVSIICVKFTYCFKSSLSPS